MATVRVTKDVCKVYFAKHAFLSDLGECHHLEIVTLRFHLGSGSIFKQRCKYSPIFLMTVLLEYFIVTVLLEYINHFVLINE